MPLPFFEPYQGTIVAPKANRESLTVELRGRAAQTPNDPRGALNEQG
jgi:hypothetical protein